MPTRNGDGWDAGATYDEFMGRWSRPGGHVAAYVWDYAEGMEFLRYFWDAARAIDGQAAQMDEGNRFPLCSPQQTLFEAGTGFEVSATEDV